MQKRCEDCPANREYWKWKLSWTGDEQCIMEKCRQPDQVTCAFCPVYICTRSEYREKVASIKKPQQIRAVEDDLVFASLKSAAEYYTTSQAAVSKVLDKPNLTLRGQHFVRWNCFKCAELHKVEG